MMNSPNAIIDVNKRDEDTASLYLKTSEHCPITV